MENYTFFQIFTTMCSKHILLVLALLVVATNTQGLAFDLRGIKYTPASDFWDVEVPCTGGSGQYSYEYNIPAGWRYENNKFRIPTNSIKDTRNQYSVRSRVRDTVKGDVLQRSLIFKPFLQGSTYSLEVSDRDYFYGSVGASAGASSGASIHGIDVLNRLGAMVKNIDPIPFNSGVTVAPVPTVPRVQVKGSATGVGQSFGGLGQGAFAGSGSSNSFGGVSGVTTTGLSGVGSVGFTGVGSSGVSGSLVSTTSVYSSLPSVLELDKMINAGAIVEIIKTIQLVVDSKIKCEAKSAYLSDFLGRIYAAIEVKKFTLNELKAIVTQATAQIQKLTLQITNIKTQQAALNLTELKKQLDALVIQLKAAYEQYNKFSTSTTSYETEINSLEKEITEINIKYSQVQKNLQSWRKSVQSIDTEIAEYEIKIKNLKQKRLSFTQDITKAETFIRDSDVQIKSIREKITTIKTKITTSTTTIETLKKAYLEIQAKVTSVKASYESANTQYVKYDREITSITVEIERYQKQTSELEGRQVSQQIENLQSAITQIKSSIDFIKFKCFNAGNIELDTDGTGKACYHFGQNQWFNYVGSSYDLSQQIRNSIAQKFNNEIIEISTVNVFSDAWRQSYGPVFDKDIAWKGQNWRTDTSFKFESDFSCSADFGNTFSRSGVIQDIRGNIVNVRGDDGKDYNLRLGSCSCFQGPGKNFLPVKGHNILWRGAQSQGGNAFNLHSGTCY